MSSEQFVDYYELLQVSPNADTETIDRIFRHFAKQLHPDAPGGDTERFNSLVEAHRTLRDPEKRAAYDVRYKQYWDHTWKLASDLPDVQPSLDDDVLRERLLQLFYTQRRSSMDSPGIGELALGRLLECPNDLLEFHLWYLKEKGWIARLESGAFALSVDGVDMVEAKRQRLDPATLLSSRLQPTNSNGG